MPSCWTAAWNYTTSPPGHDRRFDLSIRSNSISTRRSSMPTRKPRHPKDGGYQEPGPAKDGDYQEPEPQREEAEPVEVHQAYLEHRLAGGAPATPAAYRRAVDQFQRLPGAIRSVPPVAPSAPPSNGA